MLTPCSCHTQTASTEQIVGYSVFVFHHPTVQMAKLRSPSWPLNPRPLLPHTVPSPAFPELLSLVSDHWSPWERASGPGREHCCPRGSSVRSGILLATTPLTRAPKGPRSCLKAPGGAGGLGRDGHSLLETHTPVRGRLQVSTRCCPTCPR